MHVDDLSKVLTLTGQRNDLIKELTRLNDGRANVQTIVGGLASLQNASIPASELVKVRGFVSDLLEKRKVETERELRLLGVSVERTVVKEKTKTELPPPPPPPPPPPGE